jgi:hypothetical protein
MPKVAKSNQAFKIIAINVPPIGAPEDDTYHLIGQELTQLLSIPKEVYDVWQPKIGGWVDFENTTRGCQPGAYPEAMAVYREDLLPNTVGDFDGDSLGDPLKKPVNFSRLDKLFEYSNGRKDPSVLNLVQSMRVFTRRHGGAYGAMLINNRDHGNDAFEMIAEDYGLSHHLSQRPWFPYRESDTATGAITALMDFLNNELTQDREQLINWSVNCALFEYKLSQGGDGYYDIATGWCLSAEEAYAPQK